MGDNVTFTLFLLRATGKCHFALFQELHFSSK